MSGESHQMGRRKSRYSYTTEFKAEAVRLQRESGKSVAEAARDIGVAGSTLGKWIRQAEIDEGGGPKGALTTDEREELVRLRREVRQVKQERDFLKKATAFFARESS
jgi:transposase